MESQSIIGMAAGFVGLAIMLGLGTVILGGAVTDCGQLDGSPESRASVGGLGSNPTGEFRNNDPSAYKSSPSATGTITDRSTVDGEKDSWAYTCALNASQAQSAYSLLLVSLIIMGAAVVLIVVRMLT